MPPALASAQQLPPGVKPLHTLPGKPPPPQGHPRDTQQGCPSCGGTPRCPPPPCWPAVAGSSGETLEGSSAHPADPAGLPAPGSSCLLGSSLCSRCWSILCFRNTPHGQPAMLPQLLLHPAAGHLPRLISCCRQKQTQTARLLRPSSRTTCFLRPRHQLQCQPQLQAQHLWGKPFHLRCQQRHLRVSPQRRQWLHPQPWPRQRTLLPKSIMWPPTHGRPPCRNGSGWPTRMQTEGQQA